MTSESAYCFAADLGGTKLAAAMADARGRIVAELTEPTDRRGGAFVAEQIAACADKLAQAVGIEVTRTRHVMVGVPGVIDPRTGRVSLIPNIAGLQDFDILGYLRGRFGPDVAIENDVNLAMLGEQALGCASGCHNAAFLALGTGAGLGLLIDDKLFRGARGAAGEIADLPIARAPTSQIPSATGAFELEVGSLAIVDRYRRQGGTAAVTVRDIFRLLEEGDEVAAPRSGAHRVRGKHRRASRAVWAGPKGPSRALLSTHHHRTQPAWRSSGAYWRRVRRGARLASEP